jgi:hypothetical protein
MEKPLVYKSASELPENTTIVEAYQGSREELFFIENPSKKKGMDGVEQALSSYLDTTKHEEVWVYYPWKQTAVHTVSEELYYKLRTSRNRFVITDEEQKAYRDTFVGIAGLSVGSAILSALVISGGPKSFKIADFDTIEITNLNRLNADLLDVGENKTHVAAKRAWALDPFAGIELWENGITKETLEKFILDPKLDIFIDEMDSIDLKIAGRLIAKTNKIPVLMATDNGDGVILDVERFDLESDREIFHGLLADTDISDLSNLTYRDWLMLATKIVGPEYLTGHMQQSIVSIGKTIPSVPQVGTSATMAGSAMAFAIRKIRSGESMPSGRYVINLEEKLIPDFMSEASIKSREDNTQKFKEGFKK